MPRLQQKTRGDEPVIGHGEVQPGRLVIPAGSICSQTVKDMSDNPDPYTGMAIAA
jgi:hypothetical protein